MRETVRQRQAAVEEITQALGDPVARKSQAWWQYFFVVNAIGVDAARALVTEVRAIEDQGGMTTRDGARRRTPGGVFFVLAKNQLGGERMHALRAQAERYFQERMVKRFVRFLVLVAPARAPNPLLIPLPDARRGRSPRPRRDAKGREAARPAAPPARGASAPSKGAAPERRREEPVDRKSVV